LNFSRIVLTRVSGLPGLYLGYIVASTDSPGRDPQLHGEIRAF